MSSDRPVAVHVPAFRFPRGDERPATRVTLQSDPSRAKTWRVLVDDREVGTLIDGKADVSKRPFPGATYVVSRRAVRNWQAKHRHDARPGYDGHAYVGANTRQAALAWLIERDVTGLRPVGAPRFERAST